MTNNSKVSVFSVDRSQFVREGIEALLASSDDLQYVGGSEGGKGTVDAIKKSSADVVLIDVNTYSPKVVEICYDIAKENPNTKMLCLLTEASRGVVDECMTTGSIGIMVKECSFDELSAAIRKISGGERCYGPKITAVLARNYADQVIYGSKRTNRLTDRDRNVIRMTANGKSVIQISEIIGKSSKTVDAARRNVMIKLDIKSIAELTKFAIKHGLASLD